MTKASNWGSRPSKGKVPKPKPVVDVGARSLLWYILSIYMREIIATFCRRR
ncbi:MAG: hypothetical protein JXP73_12730 [Deltaproteobacteria bacterium]|nr:hypothetical protein [Deltaproteobacteria bacterium]